MSGQKDFVEIKGSVISSSNLNDSDLVKDAEITLKIGDSIYVRQFTNEKGEYSFLVKKIKRPAQIEIHPVKKTRSVKRKHKCYLNSNDLGLIADISSRDIFIKDFSLNEISHCGPILPDLEFSYNLLEPKFFEISYTGESKILPVEEAYIIIISILDDNPSMTIEISGHSDSKENNPVELSLQRSKAIEDALIKRGIAKERLISKGYGCTQLLVTDDIIKKTSNKTERQALRQKNCRVSIKILNFDYKK